MTASELIAEIQQRNLSRPAQESLQAIFGALGMVLQFCRLESCQRPFVPKKSDHVYCSKQHSNDDWNNSRRVERDHRVTKAFNSP
jgi:hypothetical protein